MLMVRLVLDLLQRRVKGGPVPVLARDRQAGIAQTLSVGLAIGLVGILSGRISDVDHLFPRPVVRDGRMPMHCDWLVDFLEEEFLEDPGLAH